MADKVKEEKAKLKAINPPLYVRQSTVDIKIPDETLVGQVKNAIEAQRAAIDTLSNDSYKTALKEQIDKAYLEIQAQEFRVKNKALLGLTQDTVQASNKADLLNAYYNHGLNTPDIKLKDLLPREGEHLATLLGKIGDNEKIKNLKDAEVAVRKAAADSDLFSTTNILAAEEALQKTMPDGTDNLKEDYNDTVDAAKAVKAAYDGTNTVDNAQAAINKVDDSINKQALQSQLDAIKYRDKYNTIDKNDKDAINIAIDKYHELSPQAQEVLDKILPNTLSNLEELKNKLAEAALKNAKEKVTAVSKDSGTINEATNAYNQLTLEQQASDPNLKKVIDAAKAINDAKNGNGTIDEARNKANLVTNPHWYEGLIAQIENLQAQADADKFKTENATYIKAPTAGVAIDEDAIKKALYDYNKLSDKAKALLGTTVKDNLEKWKEKLYADSLDDALRKLRIAAEKLDDNSIIEAQVVVEKILNSDKRAELRDVLEIIKDTKDMVETPL